MVRHAQAGRSHIGRTQHCRDGRHARTVLAAAARCVLLRLDVHQRHDVRVPDCVEPAGRVERAQEQRLDGREVLAADPFPRVDAEESEDGPGVLRRAVGRGRGRGGYA